MAKSKSSIGRPPSPEGRVTLNITLPPEIAAWLKATGNASGAVLGLVNQEISKRQTDGWNLREAWNQAKRRERK